MRAEIKSLVVIIIFHILPGKLVLYFVSHILLPHFCLANFLL